MTTLPLLARYPQLRNSFPVAGLLVGATPVEPLPGAQGVWIKRDDLTATDYGGNKVRKLDFLLAGARARGRRTVVAFGYAGSNFVAATAWHGRKLGLHTIGGLLPQAPADYVVDNLSVSLASGAELFVRDGQAALVAEAGLRAVRALLRDRAPPTWIPPGGSNACGALGFVNAGLELAEQVDAGQLPAPARIVLPFSSMGTVAGLALGLHLAELPVRISAVQVVDRRFASRARLRSLIGRLKTLLSGHGIGSASLDRLLDTVDIREEFFGAGYARADAVCDAAIARFGAALPGARADRAYTGKALACLYADLESAQAHEPVLYWHTLSASRRPASVPRALRDAVPEGLRAYWD